MKIVLMFVFGMFAFALVDATISTTAHSQSKRKLDNRVPSHLPIKVTIKKEHQEGFEDLNHEHWPWNFVLEVKNTGDRPIYGLGLVWELTEVRAPDGNPYGATMRYGTLIPGQRPRPEDVPIKPGETCVLKLNKPTAGGLENFAKEPNVPLLTTVMIWHHYVCFGDGTCLDGPEGKDIGRRPAP